MKTKKELTKFGQTLNVPIEIIPLLINVLAIGCSIAYSKGVNSR